MVLILVGRGGLATVVKDYLIAINQNLLLWSDISSDWVPKQDESYVIIYASNANRINEVLEFHVKHDIPLINGCTDVDADFLGSFPNRGVIVHALNWDLSIVGLMAALKEYGSLVTIDNTSVEILESHQQS